MLLIKSWLAPRSQQQTRTSTQTHRATLMQSTCGSPQWTLVASSLPLARWRTKNAAQRLQKCSWEQAACIWGTTSIASIAATRARGICNEGVLQVADSAHCRTMASQDKRRSLTECLRNSNQTHPDSTGALLPALGPGTINQKVVWTGNVLCCAKHSGNRIRGKDNVTEPKRRKEIGQCGNIDEITQQQCIWTGGHECYDMICLIWRSKSEKFTFTVFIPSDSMTRRQRNSGVAIDFPLTCHISYHTHVACMTMKCYAVYNDINQQAASGGHLREEVVTILSRRDLHKVR